MPLTPELQPRARIDALPPQLVRWAEMLIYNDQTTGDEPDFSDTRETQRRSHSLIPMVIS